MKLQPKRLERGETIGVIAPSSPPNIQNVKNALPFLESFGLNVKIGDSVEKKYGYLAGADEDRLDDLHRMFEDPAISGIICACGGFGAARFTDRIDFGMIRENPKVFWGYSDITYLHTAIGSYSDLVTFHGPMLTEVGRNDFDELSAKMFSQLFEPVELHYTEAISPLHVFRGGAAEGELTGGNLSLLRSGIGTKFEIDVKGKLLLIEAVNKKPHEVDAMLNQLRQARKLEEAAGIIIGDFKNAEPADEKESLDLETVFHHYFDNLNVPVISGFKIGHCSPHFAVPLGVKARLDADGKALTVLPGVK